MESSESTEATSAASSSLSSTAVARAGRAGGPLGEQEGASAGEHGGDSGDHALVNCTMRAELRRHTAKRVNGESTAGARKQESPERRGVEAAGSRDLRRRVDLPRLGPTGALGRRRAAVAQAHYLGALRRIPADATTLEAAMEIEAELERLLGGLGRLRVVG